jgi:hypothetical protein
VAAPGVAAYPFQFVFDGFLPGAFFPFLLFQPFLFLFQPLGIIAFEGNPVAAIQFQDPAGDVIQKVSIIK